MDEETQKNDQQNPEQDEETVAVPSQADQDGGQPAPAADDSNDESKESNDEAAA